MNNHLYYVTFKFNDDKSFRAPMCCKMDDALIFSLRETYAKCLPKHLSNKSFDKDIKSILLEKQ